MAANHEFARRYGPWALVTGAAQGLGAALCAELLARGLAVVALDRDAAALAALVSALGERGTLEPLHLDLAAPQLEAALGQRELGLLVNNAAISAAAPFFSHTREQLRLRQRVNCEAPLLLTHMLGASMCARGRGGVLFVSSLSMVYGGPFVAHYAATKAFVATLGEGLHEELRARGVDVTSVLAPLMDTPGLRATQPTGRMTQAVSPERVARASLDALGRRGRVTPGRDGLLLTALLQRLLPRRAARRLVAAKLRAMYPELASSDGRERDREGHVG